MPRPVVERAVALLDGVDLVNAYGLTETSSTIAVLGPDDHRACFASDDSTVRARLGSVGQALPGVELSIRDPDGQPLPEGEVGEIWVRGEQVSGEYLGREHSGDDGWFNTRDAGWLDSEGFLFVQGRLDDVIVRGGENLSPGEIEGVLLEHPDCALGCRGRHPRRGVGRARRRRRRARTHAAADEQELRDHVRAALRSARTPERIALRGGASVQRDRQAPPSRAPRGPQRRVRRRRSQPRLAKYFL